MDTESTEKIQFKGILSVFSVNCSEKICQDGSFIVSVCGLCRMINSVVQTNP